MPAEAPDREAVLAALDRILAWPEMARSPQLGRFLDYIVRRTLDGDEGAIKAYSIAVDVFGRSVDFDPQSDPIVRVQARRLRGLLEQFYAGDGSAETIWITLPVGRYVPEFGVAPDREGAVPTVPAITAASARRHITLSWFSLLVVTLGVVALAYSISTMAPRQRPPAPPQNTGPSVTVVEFQNLAVGGEEPVVAGLALELVTDLDAFEDIDARYGEAPLLAPPADTPPSDFVLTGIVRRADDAVQYSAILTETGAGTVVWSRTIGLDQQRSIQPDALDEISRTLSLALGSPRGPLHRPARRMLDGQGVPASGENLYLCRVLFDLYRETGTSVSGGRAAACFDGLPETERQAPVALAASASLLAEGIAAPDAPLLDSLNRLSVSAASMQRARELAPLSAFVWEQQARWFESQGELEAAAAAYASSIQLNPASADALAAAARLMALQGRLSEAEPLAAAAASGSGMPPAWYFAVPTLMALHEGHAQMAVANAQTYATADPELGSVLAVVAASQEGNAAVVNRYLPQVLEVAAFRATGILPHLRKRISDAVLLDQISTALTSAGVPKAALERPF